MADDLLKRIDIRRAIYKNNSTPNSSELVRAVNEVKNELKVQTDIAAMSADNEITNIKDSPYLPDQKWYRPLAIKGTDKETEWKKVKSYEEERDSFAFEQTKKLNII